MDKLGLILILIAIFFSGIAIGFEICTLIDILSRRKKE